MTTIVAANPFRCRMWHLHDRLEAHISEASCAKEIESFAKNGQMVPVLGRRIDNNTEFDYELYYGARRLFVARHLNMQLFVELRDLTEREALIAMDNENRMRVDISPYERGRSYAAWLQKGLFRSQEDLARAIRMSASQVSRLLKVGRLPSVVVGAFRNPNVICEEWGLAISEALEDPQRRQATIQKARALGSGTRQLSPSDVYRQIISAAASGNKLRHPKRDEVVKSNTGAVIFRVRQLRHCVGILLPIHKASADKLAAIKGSIAEIMGTPLESSCNRPQVFAAADNQEERNDVRCR